MTEPIPIHHDGIAAAARPCNMTQMAVEKFRHMTGLMSVHEADALLDQASDFFGVDGVAEGAKFDLVVPVIQRPDPDCLPRVSSIYARLALAIPQSETSWLVRVGECATGDDLVVIEIRHSAVTGAARIRREILENRQILPRPRMRGHNWVSHLNVRVPMVRRHNAASALFQHPEDVPELDPHLFFIELHYYGFYDSPGPRIWLQSVNSMLFRIPPLFGNIDPHGGGEPPGRSDTSGTPQPPGEPGLRDEHSGERDQPREPASRGEPGHAGEPEPTDELAPAAELATPPSDEPAAAAEEAVPRLRPEAADPAAPDELTRITGVGPAIARLLVRHGIDTFARLAATPVPQLERILEQAGGTFRLRDPSRWPELAAELAE